MFWADFTEKNETCYFLLPRLFFLGPGKIFEIMEPESLLSCAGEPP
jgi:hypothetical protein